MKRVRAYNKVQEKICGGAVKNERDLTPEQRKKLTYWKGASTNELVSMASALTPEGRPRSKL